MSLVELQTIIAACPDFGVAFARRYWRIYRDLTPALTAFEIETNIAAWNSRDATSMEPPAFDLLPHFVDLACKAKAAAPVAVSGSHSQQNAHATLHFPDGSIVECNVTHGETYFERVTVGGRTIPLNQTGRLQSLAARIRRRPRTHVGETAALLDDWVTNRPTPGPRDAWVSIAAIEALHRSATTGRPEPLEPWPHGPA
jgi:predicted dehydrogenase